VLGTASLDVRRYEKAVRRFVKEMLTLPMAGLCRAIVISDAARIRLPAAKKRNAALGAVVISFGPL
jgi:hypothetical protein